MAFPCWQPKFMTSSSAILQSCSVVRKSQWDSHCTVFSLYWFPPMWFLMGECNLRGCFIVVQQEWTVLKLTLISPVHICVHTHVSYSYYISVWLYIIYLFLPKKKPPCRAPLPLIAQHILHFSPASDCFSRHKSPRKLIFLPSLSHLVPFLVTITVFDYLEKQCQDSTKQTKGKYTMLNAVVQMLGCISGILCAPLSSPGNVGYSWFFSGTACNPCLPLPFQSWSTVFLCLCIFSPLQFWHHSQMGV